MRVPIEDRVLQGLADEVRVPKEELVVVLLDVPVLEEVVDAVIVLDGRPDALIGEADAVFVPIRLFVLACVGTIVLVP